MYLCRIWNHQVIRTDSSGLTENTVQWYSLFWSFFNLTRLTMHAMSTLTLVNTHTHTHTTHTQHNSQTVLNGLISASGLMAKKFEFIWWIILHQIPTSNYYFIIIINANHANQNMHFRWRTEKLKILKIHQTTFKDVGRIVKRDHSSCDWLSDRFVAPRYLIHYIMFVSV